MALRAQGSALAHTAGQVEAPNLSMGAAGVQQNLERSSSR